MPGREEGNSHLFRGLKKAGINLEGGSFSAVKEIKHGRPGCSLCRPGFCFSHRADDHLSALQRKAMISARLSEHPARSYFTWREKRRLAGAQPERRRSSGEPGYPKLSWPAWHNRRTAHTSIRRLFLAAIVSTPEHSDCPRRQRRPQASFENHRRTRRNATPSEMSFGDSKRHTSTSSEGQSRQRGHDSTII